jgi:O-glycosyl hydrolase
MKGLLKMFKSRFRAAICGAIIVCIGISGYSRTFGASTIKVNGAVTYQVIDGFGASDAFQIGAAIRGTRGDTITDDQSQQIMDLLFSTSKGAGLTIVRNEIGSQTTGISGDNQASIAPDAPASPSSPLTYQWTPGDDHLDGDQVWFSKAALHYGPMVVIADAWSAPAYMKTNGTLKNGGYLCGLPGQTCPSGDWRQAYANYLTQYAKFYHEAGIDLAYIGYINEPDYAPATYTGMNFDADNVPSSNGKRGGVDLAMPQNIDFIKNYLGPTLAASGLKTKIMCCDATSWVNAGVYADGILADSGVKKYLGLVTGHGYYTSPNGRAQLPIKSASQAGLHTWQTEASSFDKFSPAWDDASESSGFQEGQKLWEALTNGNVNAYLYWWFAALNQSNPDNEGFINIDGSKVTVAKRLWAFGNYSRFIRPGATRIDATTADPNLMVSAFTNIDGSIVIVVLNGSKTDTPVAISLQGVSGTAVTPYLTNDGNDLAVQPNITMTDDTLSVTVPARSLVTYTFGTGPTATATP